MPEGPSIIILKEAVAGFKGQKIIEASGNSKALNIADLDGQTIEDFKSWGKHFLICLPNFTIRIHFMLFGTYRITEHSDRDPRLHLQFADGELNFYACAVKLIDQPLDEIYDWSGDVLSPDWDPKKAIKKIKEQPGLLACDALMDQQIFSGVGNIIKNEVLFRTRIHPLSLVNKLPPKKLKEMLAEAVNYSYDFLEWKKEFTLKKHWLAHTKKICPRDHVPFHRANLGKSNRRSFYCDTCQILYR
jgi:endonuclease-8